MALIIFDLSKIFSAQKQLDEALEKAHGFEQEKIFIHKKLALLVELSELANEVKSFKYWSVQKKIDIEKINLEFADCMHFLISFANHSKKIKNIYEINFQTKMNEKQLSEFFVDIFKLVMNINDKCYYEKLIENFLILALNISIFPEDLINYYLKKNKINYDRIANKY